MSARRVAVLIGTDDWLDSQVRFFFSSSHCAVLLNKENFSKAKNLLGREFDCILYDARNALNLEALAIAGGTLKAGGILLILFNHPDWEQWRDSDSLRWSGEKQPIFTPHFAAFLRQKIRRHRIPVYHQPQLPDFRRKSAVEKSPVFLCTQATEEQSAILEEIAKRQAEIYIVTAKRGRGKSALAGLLARQTGQSERIVLTAPNKSAVDVLQHFAACELTFIAPDELCRHIRQDASQFRQDWLLIDEAAMIPLDLLDCLTSAFRHILCTTTIHGYEGTGRGFALKFINKIHRTFRCFELTKPLRWPEGDPLERFIDDLLLADAEDQPIQPNYQDNLGIRLRAVAQTELIKQPEAVYGLLTSAHYRTSPSDLRRMFDAPKQRFWLAETETALLGCVWALEEGGLNDQALIRDIGRGLRRPRGNLVPQMLAFHSGLPQACGLHSLRISRIAVQPNWQRHGIGKSLVEYVGETTKADFLSVGFGYTPELAGFWRQCGFVLAYIGERKEASSGCYTAIALRPLTEAGTVLTDDAVRRFDRHIGLSFHPSAEQFSVEPDWRLTEEDWRSLQNFADFNRTLYAALPAIRRFLRIADRDDCPLLRAYCGSGGRIPPTDKTYWLKQCRDELKKCCKKFE